MSAKIIASLVAIATVAAVAGGVTVAYFSDTESSTDNTFAAGTLVFDGAQGAQNAKWVMNNMAPEQEDSGTIILKNAGSMTGDIYPTLAFAPYGTGGTQDDANNLAKSLFVTAIGWTDTNTGTAADLLTSLIAAADTEHPYYDTAHTDKDGKLSLYELQTYLASQKTAYSEMAKLIAGETGTLNMTVQFDPAANNDFQGKGMSMTAAFDMVQENKHAW